MLHSSRTMVVGARMYARLYTLVTVLILLAPVGFAVDVTYFKTVDLTLIPSAVKNGAVCLDGSPPAYHIDRGVGDGAHKWLVHIEGGGWCDTTENCLNRTKNIFGLGSSKIMQAKNFTGLLADNQQLNPDFYNWNRVFVRYCDGASFTGNSFDPVNQLHYKGAKVFSAIVKDLLGKGMSNATNALITGCSAGGLSAILNCDKFRSFLPTHTNVKCASDAGYFLHVKDVFGEYNYANFYDRIVKLHGSTKNLPRACTATMRPRSLCFYPQYVVPHIETPLFLINSAYDAYQIGFILAPSINNLPQSWERCKNDTTTCSQDQVEILKGFRSEFLGALPKLGNGTFRGMFISSCLAHCQSQLQLNWDSDPGFRLKDKTMAEALGNWTNGRSSVQIIDDNDVPKICLTTPL
ncbi:Pectin acetylesterase [Heracleum sosnowskyi]|uniref:Pectin acetylesterase n=1 Tax=Heracleum sosnowskyi TaxID=360622 RepID=A0AAD8N3L8_9APIA|nr:Pectin acetylesterase [Heracleum sosnowskyi]